MASSGRVPRHPYGGVSARARVASRRDRLLAAGLELFGTQGYLRTTIDQVCAEAGLTKRYFYESSCSCEDLLGGLVRSMWVEAAQRGMAALEAAQRGPESRIRQGIGAVVGYYTGDTRRGRVTFFEAVGISDRIEVQRREYVGAFTTLLQSCAAELLGERVPTEIGSVISPPLSWPRSCAAWTNSRPPSTWPRSNMGLAACARYESLRPGPGNPDRAEVMRARMSQTAAAFSSAQYGYSRQAGGGGAAGVVSGGRGLVGQHRSRLLFQVIPGRRSSLGVGHRPV